MVTARHSEKKREKLKCEKTKQVIRHTECENWILKSSVIYLSNSLKLRKSKNFNGCTCLENQKYTNPNILQPHYMRELTCYLGLRHRKSTSSALGWT